MNPTISEPLVEALTKARKEWPWSTCPPEDYDRFVAEQIEPVIRERIHSALILYAERETPSIKVDLSEGDQWLLRQREVQVLRELAGDMSHSVSAYDTSSWVSGFESCVESINDRANWIERTR